MLHSIALVQFKEERLVESAATTALVSAIWKRQAPSIQVATRVRSQAQRYHRQTDCNGAQTLYDIALGMAVKSAGDRHSVTMGIMNDLSKLYRVNGRASRVAPLYARMAAALDAAPAIGAHDPTLLLDLGDLAYRLRNAAMAEQYARKALGYVNTGEAVHARSLIRALNAHAAALYALGRLDEGDQQRGRAQQLLVASGRKFVVQRQVPDPPAGSVAALYQRGDLAGAIGKANQELIAANAKQSRLTTAFANLNAASRIKPAASEPARKRARQAAHRAMRAQEEVVIARLVTAGELCHSDQRLAEAEPLYRRALALLSSRKAERSHMAGRVSYALGILLRTTGMLVEAEALQRRAYAIAEDDLGADHPNAVEAQVELAYLTAAQGKLAQAAGHYTALVAIGRRHVGIQRSVLSSYFMGLAEVQLKQKNMASAESQFIMVGQLWRSVGTRHDAMFVASLHGLAALYARQGRAVEASSVKAELAALHRVH